MVETTALGVQNGEIPTFPPPAYQEYPNEENQNPREQSSNISTQPTQIQVPTTVNINSQNPIRSPRIRFPFNSLPKPQIDIDHTGQLAIILSIALVLALSLFGSITTGIEAIQKENLNDYLFGFIINVLLLFYSVIGFILIFWYSLLTVKFNLSLFWSFTLLHGIYSIFAFSIFPGLIGLTSLIYVVLGVIMITITKKYYKNLKYKSETDQEVMIANSNFDNYYPSEVIYNRHLFATSNLII